MNSSFRQYGVTEGLTVRGVTEGLTFKGLTEGFTVRGVIEGFTVRGVLDKATETITNKERRSIHHSTIYTMLPWQPVSCRSSTPITELNPFLELACIWNIRVFLYPSSEERAIPFHPFPCGILKISSVISNVMIPVQ